MSSLWRITGMNALLKQCLPIYCTGRPFQSQRICSEHCFPSRPVGEASVLTHFLRRHQNWRATGVMKVMTNNKVFRCCQDQDNQQDLHKDYIGNNSWDSGDWLPWSAFPPSSCSARHPQSLCCWCLQLQRSMQGWWAKRQNGFAPWTCRHRAKKRARVVWTKDAEKTWQNSKLKLQELICVAVQLRISKGLKMKQVTRSSSPRTCGFKPPTDIFPTAERPDNRMKKRLMTKPRRGRAKEHGAIPANDPNVPNTKSWGKQMKGKTQNPEIKRAHQINHLMVASWLSKNTKSLKSRSGY